jgi:hypothetical protein
MDVVLSSWQRDLRGVQPPPRRSGACAGAREGAHASNSIADRAILTIRRIIARHYLLGTYEVPWDVVKYCNTARAAHREGP